jgi:hypothetical protein
MSREQMIAVLSNMDDSKLTDALSATGVPMDDQGGDYKDQMGADEPGAEGLTSWNNTSVKMPSSKRPALFDKTAHVDQAAQPAPGRPQFGQEPTGIEDMGPPPPPAVGN